MAAVPCNLDHRTEGEGVEQHSISIAFAARSLASVDNTSFRHDRLSGARTRTLDSGAEACGPAPRPQFRLLQPRCQGETMNRSVSQIKARIFLVVLTTLGAGTTAVAQQAPPQNPPAAADSELEEVVVTGYTAQKKKDIVGAVSIAD